MSDSDRSIEEFLREVDEQVAKLPPGSDLAGFITRKHREMGEMLARRVAGKREDASHEAGFSPSGVPPLRARGDEAGEDSSPKNDGSARG
jgi:hypothetical protein